MPHHHVSKRPYNGSQPQITSYFSSPSTTGPLSDRAREPNNPPLSLPLDVQSNLLSVGMRVRKAVPEGYKTGAAYSAFTLFADDTSHFSGSSAASPEPEKRYGGVSGSGGNRPRARELTPFCGILKVGGMAQQQQQWGVEEEGEEDDMECPVLSQGSTSSNDYGGFTGNGGGNKRRFEDEEEQEVEGMNFDLGLEFRAGRVMAVPVPRRKKMELELDSRRKMVFGRGQENVAVVGADGDFGEAEFLDYEGVMGEVEMDGV
ncbi:hypothetical protein LHYA1_G001569 [Lachnellula hyalina]|uniref:Uncharacterized protein n=1 Tax=Lachnellula hyalina TaxID=1316788 RepID=A0A8H8RA28_9HELO|nr:uncharacterized protein LHYA1_G001569 [Lachnellula hyalina]TVY30332.1 hypothetical protein LHYA1_G001569 [Lachnellula hyalina]